MTAYRWKWFDNFMCKWFKRTWFKKAYKKGLVNVIYRKGEPIYDGNGNCIGKTDNTGIAIDLTALFGRDNEPSLKQMVKYEKYIKQKYNTITNGDFSNEIIEKDGKKYEKIITGWDTFELREVKEE